MLHEQKEVINDYGYFADEGKEFVINTPNIPRHWYNYMWNDSYITFSSQVGFGEGFAQDSMGRRVKLITNRNIFLLDTKHGKWWTANGMPVQNSYKNYKCVHGIGYSEISLEYESIESSFRIFVPEKENCEIWTVTIRNKRPESCELKIIPYFKTDIDGKYEPQGYNTGSGYYVSEAGAVVGKSYQAFNSKDPSAIFGYLAGEKDITGYDSRKNAFIGPYGEEMLADAILDGGCKNSECIAEKLCFALEASISLQAGEEYQISFIAGFEKSIDELNVLKKKFFTGNAIKEEFVKVVDKKLKEIQNVSIRTSDENLNHLFNYWLKHQTNMGSRWARVRHNGYRDLTSDSECFGAVNPDLAWERLKRVLSYQYSNGYAPRTFLDGNILDKNFSDNTVWITFAVYSLLKEKGDLGMLDERVKFNDGTDGSVYEHIKRSVDFLWNFKGMYGLIKIWGGDWNDCLNKAGLEGKGVSVWLSIAWYRANKQFSEIARLKGEIKDAQQADERGKEMQKIIDQYGWDGEYYITAYTDNGSKIGSKECREGKIFILPQLWAVLSGVSLNNKEKAAMEAVDKYLETDLGTLVSWPAYDELDPCIGSMTQKPAGIHENGGIYLHPSTWKIAVDCILKRNDKVEMALEKILPFNHKWVKKKCEPYVMCNSYFPEITGYRYCTPGQSWRTASGAWLTKALVQFVFGLQPEIEGLRINPCLPASWRTCSIQKKFRGSIYNITYSQLNEGACNEIIEMVVNGEKHYSDIIPYQKNMQFDVEISLG